jgi:mannose-6-phosphate isomerase
VKKDYSAIDSFVIYICVEGTLAINHKGEIYSLSQGETIMFPASITSLVLNATNNVKILEVYF